MSAVLMLWSLSVSLFRSLRSMVTAGMTSEANESEELALHVNLPTGER